MSDSTSQGPDLDPPESLSLPPWEERHRWGFINALYLTIKEVLLRPGVFFGRMPARVDVWQPLLFAILVGFAASFFEWMWALAGSSLDVFLKEDVGEVLRGPLTYGGLWLFSPVLVTIEVFVTGALLHLCLLLVGGNRLGFEATMRVVAYGQATGLLVVIPFCGGVVSAIWYLVVLIVGLQRIHATDAWRAVLAVFLPLLLCLATCGGFLVTVIGLERVL